MLITGAPIYIYPALKNGLAAKKGFMTTVVATIVRSPSS